MKLYKVSEMPDLCYTYISTSNVIAIIKKGEVGYFPSSKIDTSEMTPEECEQLVDELNSKLGIDKDMAIQMSIKSMYGWVDGKDLQENNKKIEEDNDVVTNLDTVIEKWKEKSPMHDWIITDILDDIDDYNGTKLEKIKARLGDISYGCVTGVVSSLVWYSDTVKFFDDFWDDIYDLIEYLDDAGLNPLEIVKQNHSITEILMNTDSVKNQLVWICYEEVAYMFGEELENIEDDEVEDGSEEVDESKKVIESKTLDERIEEAAMQGLEYLRTTVNSLQGVSLKGYTEGDKVIVDVEYFDNESGETDSLGEYEFDKPSHIEDDDELQSYLDESKKSLR